MQIVRGIEEFKRAREALDGSVGFVPTMGALHHGHLSLIKSSKKENDYTVVSIFVNPMQFLPGEDFDAYPRREEADCRICEIAGVDILFLPESSSIYKKDEVKLKAPGYLGYILEGSRRPGHFDGVLQIVMKLFGLVRPSRAYFGKKDAQQLALIRKMVDDFFLPVEIVAEETVREDDGLALSSRNVYLSTEERKRALSISRALKSASRLIMAGELESEKIKKRMYEIMKDIDIEYIQIVDRDFRPLRKVAIRNTIILVAARVGKTRLIDNLWV